jgi:hypothetical protein
VLKDWQVSVVRNMRSVRTLSLKQLIDLPTDEVGYHLLKVSEYLNEARIATVCVVLANADVCM